MKIIEEKQISARHSNIRDSDIGKTIDIIEKFTELTEKRCVLKTSRLDDVRGCAFLVNDEGSTHVLRFGSEPPHKIYQIEPLKIWDPEATLIVLPV